MTQKKRLEWMQSLVSLMTFPARELPQPQTLIVDTLKDWCPNKLQGQKHGVVFTPRAVMELMGFPLEEGRSFGHLQMHEDDSITMDEYFYNPKIIARMEPRPAGQAAK